jgi:ribosomal protein L30E
MRYAMDKDVNKLIREMIKSGEWVFVSKNSHVKLKHSKTHINLIISGSSSDNYQKSVIERDLKRLRDEKMEYFQKHRHIEGKVR